jgi:6-phosphogluconolactonase
VKQNLRLFATAAELAEGVAKVIVDLLSPEVRTRGTASIALSGGSTPCAVYEKLSSPAWRERVDWSRIHFFWGDEACGPPTARQGSYRLAEETLLKPLGIAASHIHRIQTEHPPQVAAEQYEAEIRGHFSLRAGQVPEFSVVLLGLGLDGRIASLHPHTSVLGERSKLAAAVFLEKTQSSQVTLTLPVINHARNVLILVSGRGKAQILQAVLEDDMPVYPAQLVQPVEGELLWCADSDAASALDITRYL